MLQSKWNINKSCYAIQKPSKIFKKQKYILTSTGQNSVKKRKEEKLLNSLKLPGSNFFFDLYNTSKAENKLRTHGLKTHLHTGTHSGTLAKH